MTVAPQNPSRKSYNTHPWESTTCYRSLRTAVSRANALCDDEGLRQHYVIDTSEEPFAVECVDRHGRTTVAWWTPTGIQLTDAGQYHDELEYALDVCEVR